MAYEIQYKMIGQVPQKKKRPTKAIISLLLVILLIIGAVSVKTFALPWVQEVLVPGDPAVTAAAFETMVMNLKEGTSLFDAVKTFCLEILSHAQNAP